jgi:hypothetical protein
MVKETEILINYLSTLSSCVGKVCGQEVNAIGTRLLIVRMVIDDVTSAVCMMIYKAAFGVIKCLITPSPSYVTIRKFKYSPYRSASCFDKLFPTAKRRRADTWDSKY